MLFNKISERYIKNALKGTPYSIQVKKKVTSTNTLMKEAAQNGEEEFSVIIAEEQTGGRGRLGRSFYSPRNSGIYMSILFRHAINKNALLITTDAAVCCSRVFEKMTGKDAKIKWVNDIYMNDRKVCGILTESGCGETPYAVLGIGINVVPPKEGFPQDIKDRAGAVFEKRSYRLREKVIIALLKEFINNGDRENFFDEYKKRQLVLGKEIEVIKNHTVEKAVVLDLNTDYSLLVQKENGEREDLFTGDVSIKCL